jgi:hypothetical protein
MNTQIFDESNGDINLARSHHVRPCGSLDLWGHQGANTCARSEDGRASVETTVPPLTAVWLDYFFTMPMDSSSLERLRLKEKRRANFDVPRDPLIFTMLSKATKLNQNHVGKSLSGWEYENSSSYPSSKIS